MGTVHRTDVVVLGAGAAGMMAAFTAGRRGRRVTVLEHGPEPGRKILISGGGRCNFTNIHATPESYLSANPHFVRSAMARYRPRDFVEMVERHGIRYHEKTLGQLFCDGSARQVVTMLQSECGAAGVDVRCGVSVLEVARGDDGFVVRTSVGEWHCSSVVVATGGLSIPKMGATGLGYDVARSFGHGIVEPRAGLVPLVFGEADKAAWCELSGVSCEVVAAASEMQILRRKDAPQDDKQKRKPQMPAFREKMLITHRGLSGPAMLQVSSYWQPGGEVVVDLAPGRRVLAGMLAASAGRDEAARLRALREVFPQRLAERWAVVHPQQGWTNAAVEASEAALHAWRVRPEGTEGFAKAEVTVGGVDTRELDARTMESQRVQGLYFIGEVVDVTGWLGGYNFQWAWASGFSAGEAA